MISQYARWAIIAAVLIGHFGLNVAVYNRINGFGLPRKVVKAFVKVFFVFTIMLPPLTLLFCGDVIANFARGSGYASDFPLPLAIYFSICLLSWVALGVPWLIWRPIFGIESVRTKRKLEVIDVEAILGRPLGLTSKCRFEAKIPLNQIFDLAIEEINQRINPELPDIFLIADQANIFILKNDKASAQASHKQLLKLRAPKWITARIQAQLAKK